MIIRKYGIELRRLQEPEDIELVRLMRNSEDIRKAMFFRDHITPEMQKKWFHSQNTKHNYHFIILHEGIKCGMISGKNVDFERGTSEGGIFIWEDKSIGTPVPVIASVIMAELIFNLLGHQRTYAETRSDNKIALQYNRLLGYEKLEEIKSESKILLVLSKENFNEKGQRFLTVIRKAMNDLSPLSWDDITFDKVNEQEKTCLYQGFPEHIQLQINSRLI